MPKLIILFTPAQLLILKITILYLGTAVTPGLNHIRLVLDANRSMPGEEDHSDLKIAVLGITFSVQFFL